MVKKRLWERAKKRPLGVLTLIMLNVVAVDSLRSLPFGASFGFSLISYYLVALLIFLLPVAWVSAELATTWPYKGGVYAWVREAFGVQWGFVVIWLQWVYNVVWYPTILSFIVSALAYVVDPSFASQHPYWMLVAIWVCFWGMTFMNVLGIQVSSFISTLGAVVGTMLPMLLLMLLGVWWYKGGRPPHIQMNAAHLFPAWHGLRSLAYFTVILFGLAGIELSAAHAEEVSNPAYAYPRALLYSALLIMLTLVGASLAIAMVVPHQQLDLLVGVEQALQQFFIRAHQPWLGQLVIFMMVMGGLGCVSTWIIGSTKGLWAAAQDGHLPGYFARTNRHGAPSNILWAQAVFFTVLSSLFVLLPSVNSAYWLLTAMTAQLAMMVYMMLFLAAWSLRIKQANRPRPYRIPGPNAVMGCVCLIGMLACLVTIALGFAPPLDVHFKGGVWWYDAILLGGIILLLGLPFFAVRSRSNLSH